MGTAPAFIVPPKLRRYGRMMSVILIGGSSNVGKTTAARSVAAALGATYISIDDWIPPGISGSSPFHDDRIWSSDPDELVTALRAHTGALAPTVRERVEHARARRETVVIEGEGIEPRFATRLGGDDVHAVFVVEGSVERIRATLQQRDSPGGRHYCELPSAAQHAIARMNVDYGRWIRAEAEALQLAWVSSQPWSTLVTRILAVTQCQAIDHGPGSMDTCTIDGSTSCSSILVVCSSSSAG